MSDTGTSPRREDISELSSETTTWPAWIRQHRAALGRGDRHAWAVLDAAVSEHQALTVIEDNPDSPAPTIRHLNPVPPATNSRTTSSGSPDVTDVSEHLGDLIAHHTKLRDLQTVIDNKTTAPEHRAQATVAARNSARHCRYASTTTRCWRKPPTPAGRTLRRSSVTRCLPKLGRSAADSDLDEDRRPRRAAARSVSDGAFMAADDVHPRRHHGVDLK